MQRLGNVVGVCSASRLLRCRAAQTRGRRALARASSS